MIIAKGLAVEAGGRRLVEEADLALYPGDKAGLVGRNGAGKTTLLRTLAGLRPAAVGTVAAQGVIGYLSQEAALPELERPEATAPRHSPGSPSANHVSCRGTSACEVFASR